MGRISPKDRDEVLARINAANAMNELDAIQAEMEARHGAVPKVITDALDAAEDRVQPRATDDREGKLAKAARVIESATDEQNAIDLLRREGFDAAPVKFVTMKLREGAQPLREIGGEEVPTPDKDGKFIVDAERGMDIERYWPEHYAIVREKGSKRPIETAAPTED